MKDSSLFNLSLTDPAVAYNSSDGASATESHMTLPPSPCSILCAHPDLIQSETDAAWTSDLDVRNVRVLSRGKKKSFFVFHKNDIATIKRRWLFVHWQSWICSQEMATPSPAPSSVTAAPCWPASEDEQHQLAVYSVMPPSAVTTLSLHTPDLGQCTYCNQTVAGAVKPNNLLLWSTFSLMLLHWNTIFAYYGYCKKFIFFQITQLKLLCNTTHVLLIQLNVDISWA